MLISVDRSRLRLKPGSCKSPCARKLFRGSRLRRSWNGEQNEKHGRKQGEQVKVYPQNNCTSLYLQSWQTAYFTGQKSRQLYSKGNDMYLGKPVSMVPQSQILLNLKAWQVGSQLTLILLLNNFTSLFVPHRDSN